MNEMKITYYSPNPVTKQCTTECIVLCLAEDRCDDQVHWEKKRIRQARIMTSSRLATLHN